MAEGRTISRKSFLAGTAGAAAAGAMLAASGAALAEQAQGGADEADDLASQVVETVSCDLLVVGAGLSGLAAAVQAVDDGFDVVVIDSIKTLERRGPEGIGGVGSSLQKDLGIDIDVNAVMNRDGKFFNYRLDPLTWKDMLEASGANIDWLIEKGVVFTGQVDNYRDLGEFETFHWFPGDHVAWQYYSTPMADYFTGKGGQIRFETTASKLIIDDAGKVGGAYATGPDGSVIEFDAQAVVLATGGCGGSQEEIAKRFRTLPLGRYFCDGYFEDNGSGLNMALEAGGVDVCIQRCFLGGVANRSDNGDLRAFGNTRAGGAALGCCWVNQNGERYANEAGTLEFSGAPLNALMAQEDCFSVFDSAIAGDLAEAASEAGADASDTEFFAGETLADLAEAIGADPAKLEATIEQYNAYCDAGEDAMFGKPAEYLVKIETGPFFAARLVAVCHGMVGGLLVNRDFQVVRWDNSPIEGLYATGTESNMNYRETYTIEVPGTDACNTVYSGRRAAQHFAASRA